MIFFLILFILAGLIFLSMRLSEQQRKQIVAMRSTEHAAILFTNNDLKLEVDSTVNTPTVTGLSTLEPPLPSDSPTPDLMQVPMEEIAPTSTNTQPAQTGGTNPDPQQPNNTPADQTELPTSTAEPTPAPTRTPDYDIFTPVDWTGVWTAFFGDEGGLLFRATLVISREGNTITGTHGTHVFTGALSEDGLSVIGTWVNPPSSGDFGWYIVGENQFCGNTEGDFAYCAARNGASRPDPCFCNRPVE